MKSRLFSLFAGLLALVAAISVAVPSTSWAQGAKVKRLIFASAGFHESNRFWTISRPDHLQFEPFWETLVGIDPKTGDYIPALAKVPSNLFGIALVTVDGEVHTAGDVTHVGVERLLGFGLLLRRPFGHALATHDDVDQQPDQREDDEEDDPGGLGEATQRIVAEQVDDHAEQHHQHRDEQEGHEDQPDRLPERKPKHLACLLRTW